ncbi:MAG TPA: DUF2059 domain-containing protein [Pyrinomonadaceae bacterium]|jgi:hypothetical protein
MLHKIFHPAPFARLLLLFVVLVTAQGVHAQETATTMTPEKRALIKELLGVTNAEKNTEAIMNSIFSQQERDLPVIYNQMIDNETGLTSEQRAELRKSVMESALRAHQRIREKLMQRINFQQLVEEISLTVYDKHFTDGELRDLIVFYQSPTGKKTLSVMPQLFADSMQQSSIILLPKVQAIVSEVMQEERQSWQQITPKKKGTTNPPSPRRGRTR